LVKVGKIAAAISMVFSIALLPLLNNYESIFNGLNDIIAHIAPPITCVFLVGIFWKKASAISAKITLWAGSAIGAIVFTIYKLSPRSTIGQVPFIMMAFYLFCICLFLKISTAIISPAQHTAESKELYLRSPLDPLRYKESNRLGNYKI